MVNPIDLGSWLKLIGKGEAKKKGSKSQRNQGKGGRFVPCRQASEGEFGLTMDAGDSSAANQLLRSMRTLVIADLLERSRSRPKDDDAYYPSQPLPQSEDMDMYCETVSILLEA